MSMQDTAYDFIEITHAISPNSNEVTLTTPQPFYVLLK